MSPEPWLGLPPCYSSRFPPFLCRPEAIPHPMWWATLHAGGFGTRRFPDLQTSNSYGNS